MSLAFEYDERRPGEENRLVVRASAESYIGLLAVDQSVLLLKGGNDITQSQVGTHTARRNKATINSTIEAVYSRRNK